jgi:predicted acetyltransferase
MVEVPRPGRWDDGMKIRQISTDEWPQLSGPIQAYAFRPSPAPVNTPQSPRDKQRYAEEHITLVAELDGAAVADLSAVRMRQNVRGAVYPMAGLAGLATLPQVRRRGFARALITQMLGLMRESGHVVSALYPFRPSFYERFGYVGLPQARTVTFAPSGAAGLLGADLAGTVRWGRVADSYGPYLDFIGRLLTWCHGFAVLPESQMAQRRDTGDRWLATAWVNGTVAGAVTYRIAGYGGDLLADDLLTSGPLSRALLLRFLAGHTDHVARVTATIPAGELPELWATDFAAVTQATTSFPDAPAPMARVLSLEGLAGLPTGTGQVTVEVVDDPFIAGRYALDGTTGQLEVRRGAAAGPEATLTAAGLSGLVYGVLDPDEVVIRGYGRVPSEAAARLRALFPRRTPYLCAKF